MKRITQAMFLAFLTAFLITGNRVVGEDAAKPAVFEVARIVPRCDEPPTIDGKLDEACWLKGVRLNRFCYRHTGPPKHVHNGRDTDLRLCFDEENLYIGVRCEEGNAKSLIAVSPGRDRPDWGDDRVEFFIDANGHNGHGPVFYLSVNSAGVTNDGILKGSGGWDPDLRIGTGTGEQEYVLELAIPLREFGKASVAGERWHLNVGRFHRAGYKGATTLVPLRRNSFIVPGKMAPLRFAGPDDVSVCRLSVGALRTDGYLTGHNVAVFEVRNPQLQPVELRFECRVVEGTDVGFRTEDIHSIGPGTRRVAVMYRVFGGPEERLNFTVRTAVRRKEPGEVLFQSSDRVAQLCSPERKAWRPEDPLFEQLLDRDADTSWRIPVHLTWGHPYKRAGYLLALQFGCEYSLHGNARALADAGFHPYLSDDWWDRYEGAVNINRAPYEWYGKRKSLINEVMANLDNGWSAPVLYGHYHVSGIEEEKRGVGLSTTHGWLPDPINRKAFV